MELSRIVKIRLSCGPEAALEIFPGRDWTGARCARHLRIRGERWGLLLDSETGALEDFFENPCKNPAPGVVSLVDRWLGLVEESVRFGSEAPYHLHFTKWSRVSGASFPCILHLSREGILVTTDDWGLRSARRISPPQGAGSSDYGFFVTGWLRIQEKSRRTEWFSEEEGKPMEKPGKLCWRDDPEGMPPNIVKWRALGAKGKP